MLNVVAGPARVGYADGVITALEASGGEAAEWAIDTGLLGGMYGQRIRIVATEAGAGVRLRGPLAASTAGIEVSGDGRVELREARAATTLEAESAAEAVAVGGALYAEESVELIGHTAVELGAGAYVGSGGEVELTAQTVRLGSGALAAAGVDSFGEPSTGGVLRVSAELLEAGQGALGAGERLEVTAGRIDLRRETDTEEVTLQSRGELVLTTQEVTAANARVAALGGLTISSDGELTLSEGSYVAGTTLDVAGQRIVSSAGLSAGGVLTVSAEEAFEHLVGGTIIGGDGVLVRVGSMDNAGQVQAQGGSLTVEATGGLSNRGTMSSVTSAELAVDGPIVNSGELLAQQALVLAGLTGRRAGAVTNRSGTIGSVAGDLTVRAASVSNERPEPTLETVVTTEEWTEGSETTTVETSSERATEDSAAAGVLQAGGDLRIETGELSNSYSRVVASGQVRIEADTLANTGLRLTETVQTTVEGPNGTTESDSETESYLGVIEAGEVLTVRIGGGLSNRGGLLSGSSADLGVDGAIDNSGAVLVAEALTVGGWSGTQAGALSNRAGGVINSGSGSYRVASLTNAGELTAHDTRLTADVSGEVSNTGSIAVETELTVELGGDLSNDGGSIVSEGQMRLSGRAGGRFGALRTMNDSLINGKAGLTIKATSVTNADRVGTVDGDLTVELTGNLVNTGLLYSGADSHYKLDGTFTNTEADVIARNHLTIEGLQSGTRAGALSNRSGRIEAITGDLTLRAALVTNERLVFAIETTESEPLVTVGDPVDLGNNCKHPTELFSDCHSSTDTTTTTEETTTETVSEASTAEAQLLAGGNMTIETAELLNSYSQIGADGNITIKADSDVTNEGYDLATIVTTTAETLHEEVHCSNLVGCADGWTWPQEDIITEHEPIVDTTYEPVYGTIHALGDLSIEVNDAEVDPDDQSLGYVNNDAIKNNEDPGHTASTEDLDDVAVDGELGTLGISLEQIRRLLGEAVDELVGEQATLSEQEVLELTSDRALLEALVRAALGETANTEVSEELISAVASAVQEAVVDGELGEAVLIDMELSRFGGRVTSAVRDSVAERTVLPTEPVRQANGTRCRPSPGRGDGVEDGTLQPSGR